METRDGFEIKFTFLAGQTQSEAINIEAGCFGTLLVPAASALIGKTLQFVAVPIVADKFAETELLSTPITLAAGANPLTADQIRECGAVSGCRLKINSSVGADSPIVLLWKS